MALGSTEPLIDMNTRDLLGGKGGRSIGLKTFYRHVPTVRKFWEPQPTGALRNSPGLL